VSFVSKNIVNTVRDLNIRGNANPKALSKAIYKSKYANCVKEGYTNKVDVRGWYVRPVTTQFATNVVTSGPICTMDANLEVG